MQSTTHAMQHMLCDDQAIQSGDLIAMNLDSLGFMAIQSRHEPFPDKAERVSHLRLATAVSSEADTSFDPNDILSSDMQRCMFTISLDNAVSE